MDATDTREERFRSTLERLIANEGVTEDALLDLLGSAESVADLTAGTRLPSMYEASLLSAFFRVNPGLLMQTAEPTMGVSLRLGTMDDIHDVSDTVDHATRLLEIDRLTREWGFTSPATDITDFAPSRVWHNRYAGEKTAARLRAYLDFDYLSPIEDLTGLIEGLGYPVEYRNLPGNVHGISVPEKWGEEIAWVILINSNDVWSRQRFTLAHELCHVLQEDAGQVIVDRVTMSDVRPEQIANSFARNFLLPEDALLNTLERHGQIANIEGAAKLVAEVILTYGISRDSAVIALADAGDQYLNSALLDFCRSTPVHEIMQISGDWEAWRELNESRGSLFPSDRLTQQVLGAYGDGLVSMQAVADVIADGDSALAAQQLREAGWEVADFQEQ
ncbi:ImmA/IrrE family metallo-endopeptidase [Streptomyces javensis]|uniref:IrrE N-terminal-like domain-containing protein n=1 Tax=Streptomyces javensis TaxID=114698 RepID=A0ABP4I150_9ACTN